MSSLYDQKQVVGNEPFRYTENGYSQQHMEHMTPQTGKHISNYIYKNILRVKKVLPVPTLF